MGVCGVATPPEKLGLGTSHPTLSAEPLSLSSLNCQYTEAREGRAEKPSVPRHREVPGGLQVAPGRARPHHGPQGLWPLLLPRGLGLGALLLPPSLLSGLKVSVFRGELVWFVVGG